MPLILLVDDDLNMVHLLALALSRYQTIFASDGVGALHQVKTENPDLVILDLSLPDIDGGMLISKIRRISNVAIIVLSGRHEQVDKVLALQAGADDFIEKPFELDDLDARVEAVLRRSRRIPNQEQQVGALHMAVSRLPTIDGIPFQLSPMEYRLLAVLAQNKGRVLSHDFLTEQLWERPPDEGSSHLVDMLVMRLRARLRSQLYAPEIVTIHGEGFRIEDASTN